MSHKALLNCYNQRIKYLLLLVWINQLTNLMMRIYSQEQIEMNNRSIFLRYRFIDQIGRGGYSVVYKAQKYDYDTHNNGYYAIKRISHDRKGNLRIIKRQISYLKKLSHPNIIKLLEIYHEHNQSYLVMQYLPYDLITFYKQYYRQNGKKIPQSMIQSIIFQISSALRYMHRDCHFIHRDIKPENIMIEFKNGDVVAKLIDFGFTVQYLSRDPLTPYMITRWYRPLEIALGLKYDFKADIFSLGALLLQLYIGKEIFRSSSNTDQIEWILRVCGVPRWGPAIQKLKELRIKLRENHQPQLLILTLGLTKEAADLIKGMLDTTPFHRYSIQQIMFHPYFKKVQKSTFPDSKLCCRQTAPCISHIFQKKNRKRNSKSSLSKLEPIAPIILISTERDRKRTNTEGMIKSEKSIIEEYISTKKVKKQKDSVLGSGWRSSKRYLLPYTEYYEQQVIPSLLISGIHPSKNLRNYSRQKIQQNNPKMMPSRLIDSVSNIETKPKNQPNKQQNSKKEPYTEQYYLPIKPIKSYQRQPPLRQPKQPKIRICSSHKCLIRSNDRRLSNLVGQKSKSKKQPKKRENKKKK